MTLFMVLFMGGLNAWAGIENVQSSNENLEQYGSVLKSTLPVGIYMEDAANDGWNGGMIVVYVGGTAEDIVTLDAGQSGTMRELTLPAGLISFEWIAGTADNEITFTIFIGENPEYDQPMQPTAGVFFTWNLEEIYQPVSNVQLTKVSDDCLFRLSWDAPADDIPIAYNIYKDGVLDANYPATLTSYETIMDEAAEWCVEAVYAGNNLSEQVCVTGEDCEFDMIYPAVTNLQLSKVSDDCLYSLNWDAPTGETPVAYNIYKDGVLDANYPATATSYETIMDEAAEWCVEAVFAGNKVSAKVCITGQDCEFDMIYPAVTNVELTLVADDCLYSLSWDAPTSATPIAYNIYKDGVLDANYPATETSYETIMDEAAEWCVEAVYADNKVSAKVCITGEDCEFNELYPAPTNAMITTEDIDNCSYTISWDAPASGTPESYNIYKDGVLEYNAIDPEYTGVIAEAAEWCIEAVYAGNNVSSQICVNSEDCTPIVSGISNQSGDAIVLGPNPAHDIININGNVAKVAVYNVLGGLVTEVQGNVKTMNVSGYTPGIYLFKVYDNNNKATVRQIIIK